MVYFLLATGLESDKISIFLSRSMDLLRIPRRAGEILGYFPYPGGRAPGPDAESSARQPVPSIFSIRSYSMAPRTREDRRGCAPDVSRHPQRVTAGMARLGAPLRLRHRARPPRPSPYGPPREPGWMRFGHYSEHGLGWAPDAPIPPWPPPTAAPGPPWLHMYAGSRPRPPSPHSCFLTITPYPRRTRDTAPAEFPLSGLWEWRSHTPPATAGR